MNATEKEIYEYLLHTFFMGKITISSKNDFGRIISVTNVPKDWHDRICELERNSDRYWWDMLNEAYTECMNTPLMKALE